MRSLIFGMALGLASVGCGGGGGDLPREGDIVQRAEVCVELLDTFCLAFYDCGFVADRGVCETEGFRGCCEDDGLCGQQVQLKRDMAPCLSDVAGLTCQEIDADVIPLTCFSLI